MYDVSVNVYPDVLSSLYSRVMTSTWHDEYTEQTMTSCVGFRMLLRLTHQIPLRCPQRIIEERAFFRFRAETFVITVQKDVNVWILAKESGKRTCWAHVRSIEFRSEETVIWQFLLHVNKITFFSNVGCLLLNPSDPVIPKQSSDERNFSFGTTFKNIPAKDEYLR